jgi:hypothetical protein
MWMQSAPKAGSMMRTVCPSDSKAFVAARPPTSETFLSGEIPPQITAMFMKDSDLMIVN